MLNFLFPLKAIFCLYIAGILALFYRSSAKSLLFPYFNLNIGNLTYAEIASHGTIILVVNKILFSSSYESDVVFGVLLCFSASFLVGTLVGKTSISGQGRGSVSNDVAAPEDSISFKCTAPPIDATRRNSILFCDSDTVGSLLPENINGIISTSHFLPQCTDIGSIVQKGISAVNSITGQIKSRDYTYEYVNNSWKTIHSEDNLHVSMSTSKKDGILFRGSTCIGCSPPTILKWILLDNDIPTGIESVSYKKETLQSWKDGEIVLRRFMVKSGSIRSSNRMFTVITSVAKASDGIITVASRSADIPIALSDIDRKVFHSHGCIKAIMFASGYVIKPIPPENGRGASSILYFGSHLGMFRSNVMIRKSC